MIRPIPCGSSGMPSSKEQLAPHPYSTLYRRAESNQEEEVIPPMLHRTVPESSETLLGGPCPAQHLQAMEDSLSRKRGGEHIATIPVVWQILMWTRGYL